MQFEGGYRYPSSHICLVLSLFSLSVGLLVCWISQFFFIQGIGLLLVLEGTILLTSGFSPRGFIPPPTGRQNFWKIADVFL